MKGNGCSVVGSPVYLDYNATAPLRPQALQRMQPLLAEPLNPSSVHGFGREAKKYLESARRLIAEAVSAWPNEVVFMASGTEGNVTALRGAGARVLMVSAIEHSSVLKPASGAGLIPVTATGVIDLAALDAMLAANTQPVLVSVMMANNETGVIQPVQEVAVLCKRHQALFHCDAIQALGKIPVDFGAMGADMMTLSAHKCGGPLGAAALLVRRDLPMTPLLTGGGQELGRRAGTENVASIAGFAAAVEAAVSLEPMRGLRGWLEAMEAELETSGGIIFGKTAERLPNTVCVAMPGVSNEVQLMDFDLKGFAVSAGSACSSGRIEPSHVLSAMGVPVPLASTALRISAGWATTHEEIQRFTEVWRQTSSRLRKKAV